MPRIHLYGGECDGYWQRVPFSQRPDIFYAVPLADMAEIKNTVRGPLAKEVALRRAQRLAYTFQRVQVGEEEMEYRYERSEQQDKALDL